MAHRVPGELVGGKDPRLPLLGEFRLRVPEDFGFAQEGPRLGGISVGDKSRISPQPDVAIRLAMKTVRNSTCLRSTVVPFRKGRHVASTPTKAAGRGRMIVRDQERRVFSRSADGRQAPPGQDARSGEHSGVAVHRGPVRQCEPWRGSIRRDRLSRLNPALLADCGPRAFSFQAASPLQAVLRRSDSRRTG